MIRSLIQPLPKSLINSLITTEGQNFLEIAIETGGGIPLQIGTGFLQQQTGDPTGTLPLSTTGVETVDLEDGAGFVLQEGDTPAGTIQLELTDGDTLDLEYGVGFVFQESA